MINIKKGALLLLVFLLSSCASMSKNECVTANWHAIGYEDGTKGLRTDRITFHRKACANHGITADGIAYSTGFKKGTLEYCSYSRGIKAGQAGNRYKSICPTNSEYHSAYYKGLDNYCVYDKGYRRGYTGAAYNKVCPKNTKKEFAEGYELGKKIHLLKDELSDVSGYLDDIASQSIENDKNIDVIKGRIAYDQSLFGVERAELLEELEYCQVLRGELIDEQTDLEIQQAGIYAELEELGYTAY